MEKLFNKKGQAGYASSQMIVLIVGVGVAILVLIFVSVLGGQTYQLSEAKIDAITNTTVRDAVKASAVNGFDALEQTSSYMPLVVLAAIIGLVLTIVLGFTQFGGGSGGRGSAL
jgi:hypothetical protein